MDRGLELDSLISEGDTLLQSHYSTLSTQQHQMHWFTDQRSYSRQVLGGWGLTVGQMPYTNDNQTTLKCIVELIGLRQRDIQFRGKAKEEMTALQFEKEKYRSYMEQGQRTIQEHSKRIGRLQNENNQLRLKARKGETQYKKQREQDRKMLGMLKSKNQQILHQIKKKQQEVSRVKQQMRKSVGQKGVVYKNSFQILGDLQSSPKKMSQNAQQIKFGYLLQRNQRELTHALKQNALLRQKIYGICQQLYRFGEWIDQQVFGQKRTGVSSHRFFINHNLMLRQGAITDELNQLLQITKEGISQTRKLFKYQKQKQQPRQMLQDKDPFQAMDFKKGIKVCKTQRAIKIITDTHTPRKEKQKGGTSKGLQPQNMQIISSPRASQPILKKVQSNRRVGGITKPNKTVNSPIRHVEESPFSDTIISQVQMERDCSIVSHISVEQLGKNRFDKWDMLYDQQE